MNPWTIIGGVASTVAASSEVVMPVNAQPGDVLVLTKPLGTQVAVNMYQWMHQTADTSRWDRVKALVSPADVMATLELAEDSMTRLNRTAARLMRKYNGHAATDVTGFGLVGHLTALAQNQTRPVDFVLDVIPVLHVTARADAHLNHQFGLVRGTSAETSGTRFTRVYFR